MTLAEELAHIGGRLMVVAPDEAQRLLAMAAKVRRVELALQELADDALEQAQLAELNAVVVAFPRRQ